MARADHAAPYRVQQPGRDRDAVVRGARPTRGRRDLLDLDRSPGGAAARHPARRRWLGDALFFVTGENERKAKNLSYNPHVVMTTGCAAFRDGFDIVIEGDAVRVTDDGVLGRIADLYASKYDWHYEVHDGTFRETHGPDPSAHDVSPARVLVFEVAPTTVFGYGRGETFNATRDTGVVLLDTPPSLPTTPLVPENYLDQFEQPLFNSTEFLVIGYGTEVRGNPPTAGRQPIVRRFTTEIGQSLDDQVFQTNANENYPRAGGGTCFGDSGGPSILDGYLVGDTSFGLTSNCRYIGGYQRVDIPVVCN